MALLPLLYFSFWTMNWFRIHFAEPSNRLTLERVSRQLYDHHVHEHEHENIFYSFMQ